jgi:hypothetical protein
MFCMFQRCYDVARCFAPFRDVMTLQDVLHVSQHCQQMTIWIHVNISGGGWRGGGGVNFQLSQKNCWHVLDLMLCSELSHLEEIYCKGIGVQEFWQWRLESKDSRLDLQFLSGGAVWPRMWGWNNLARWQSLASEKHHHKWFGLIHGDPNKHFDHCKIIKTIQKSCT